MRLPVRPPQRLAVHGNHLARRGRRLALADTVQPTDQVVLQDLRADRLKGAAEGVVRRDAVGQVEEASEKVFLGAGKGLDLHEVLGPAQHGAKADGQDVLQTMAEVFALPSGIGDLVQGFHQRRAFLGWHGASSRILREVVYQFMGGVRQAQALAKQVPEVRSPCARHGVGYAGGGTLRLHI